MKYFWKKPEPHAYNKEILIWTEIGLLDIWRYSLCILLWKSVLLSPTPHHFPLVHSDLTSLKFSWPFLTSLLTFPFHVFIYSRWTVFFVTLTAFFCLFCFVIATPVVLNSIYLWAKQLLTGLFKNRKTTKQFIWCSKPSFLSKKETEIFRRVER